jgi:hypothetical protein
MTPNVTVGYMAEQINRGRLDGEATRDWLAVEAARKRARASGPATMPAMLGAVLIRLGERMQGTAQHLSTSADSPVPSVR